MSKTLRVRKNGTKVYEIRVSRGRDPITGKQLTPYSMTWTIPENYSAKRAEREASKIEGEFIAKCKAGEVLTKQEELRRRKEQAEQAELDRLEQASKPTFAEYKELYLKRIENQGHAAGTVESYKRTLNRASDILGKVKMENISKGMIRQYVSDLFEEYDFKYTTQVRHFAVLKVMFDTAVDDGTIETNPMNDLKRPRKPKDEKAENGQDKAYSENEVAYIMECLEKEPLKWKTLMVFMLDTGCRRGEVAGMKWENINLETGEVTVCNNRQYTPGKGVYDTTPKSGKPRTLFLTDTALKLMKEWKRQQQAEFTERKVIHLFKSGYCFHGATEEGMHPTYLSRYFREFGEKYGITNFHPHRLRHTMATLSIANGADIVSVSKKLGHYSPALTLNVYSHANEEAQRRANDALAKALYTDQKQA